MVFRRRGSLQPHVQAPVRLSAVTRAPITARHRQLTGVRAGSCRGAVHGLGADDVEESDLVCGFAPGDRGVGDDAQIAAGGYEHVAVESEHSDVRVVDALGVRFVGAHDPGVPQSGEGVAGLP